MESLTPLWVVNDDVIAEVKAGGVTDERDAQIFAQRIWTNVCFPPDIYRTVQGVEATQAEFICQWLHEGIPWEACITYSKTLSRVKGAKRELSPTFREAAMKRLKDNVAETYRPRRIDEAETGDDSD